MIAGIVVTIAVMLAATGQSLVGLWLAIGAAMGTVFTVRLLLNPIATVLKRRNDLLEFDLVLQGVREAEVQQMYSKVLETRNRNERLKKRVSQIRDAGERAKWLRETEAMGREIEALLDDVAASLKRTRALRQELKMLTEQDRDLSEQLDNLRWQSDIIPNLRRTVQKLTTLTEQAQKGVRESLST
jgi:predicted  nucleic acid-binding Zn-ribbon protein